MAWRDDSDTCQVSGFSIHNAVSMSHCHSWLQWGRQQPGTLTFVTPKSRKLGYTLPEIIDLLNEELSSQKYLLIRRAQSFAIIASDRPIDPSLLPRIDSVELDSRGNTELVQTTLA